MNFWLAGGGTDFKKNKQTNKQKTTTKKTLPCLTFPATLCLGPKEKDRKTDYRRGLLSLFGSKPFCHRESVSQANVG